MNIVLVLNERMVTAQQEAFIIAGLSILFYGSLSLVSYHYYRKFVNIELQLQQDSDNPSYSSSLYYRNQYGKYDDTKKYFFLLLTISSLCDIPSYFVCLYQNGPDTCQTNTIDWLFTYFFHSVALSGYAYCIILPCMLWSDMITGKDGKLFYSNFEDSLIKIFFKIILIIYILNLIIGLLCTIIYFAINPETALERLYYSITAFTEAILTVLLTGGCLLSGLNLLTYVKNAKLPIILERKFIISLNIILSIMVLSFLSRAILVIGLSSFMPDIIKIPLPYSLYTIISRWLPDIFCQFCLILIMRFSGNEIINKNSHILLPSSSSSSPSFSSSSIAQSLRVTVYYLSCGLLYSEEINEINQNNHNKDLEKDGIFSTTSSDRLLDLKDHLLTPKQEFLDQIRNSLSSPGVSAQYRKVPTESVEYGKVLVNLPPRLEQMSEESEETSYFHSMISDFGTSRMNSVTGSVEYFYDKYES